ncbi:formate dehydrogenase subunit alpha [Actinobacillus equuli]|nr:formate dehydrogenase subunit alpha [Actinobacillus equuli]
MNGDTVKVSSKRGFIKAKAVVTKRVRSVQADGKTIHTVGIPIHGGFATVGKKGYLANSLTGRVGDANTQPRNIKRSWSILRKSRR